MKRAAMILLVLLVLLAVSSCKLWDTLFFGAESVDVDELASYTGTLPTTRMDAIMTMANPSMGALLETIGTTVGSPTITASSVPLLSLIPSFRRIEPLLNMTLSKAVDRSVIFTMTDFTSDALDVELHLEVENESITGPYGGTVDIEILRADLEGSKSAAAPPLNGTVDFDGEAKITATGITDGAGNFLNTGILNAKTHGDMEVDLSSTGMPTYLKYYLALDFNAGLSVTNADGTGGKFIITFRYIDRGELDAADFEYPENLVSDFELEITIEVYNNSNDLVETYHINQDDIADLIGSGL